MATTPDHAPAPPTGRGKLVLAALCGFAVGSGALGLLWGLSASTDGPAADARAACAALERVGELPAPTEGPASSALTQGVLPRILAARELAAAAAEFRPQYRELADHLDGVSRMVVSLNLADEGGRWHLSEARKHCALV
ncbi:hypothetical protein SAMN05216266_101825 [Amycolatopsis marina]|uniref:Uncharacterized protein n=1 Tax=Amycolatopsis marina TaxID=490629 RepID=A0A1I0W7Y1_9PSEU|nr:hypothetical protein [Amycolatopsis marina]SFA84859.1 hypothetical protein SAMN05216266_101825 [Amycolatopsis marina]